MAVRLYLRPIIPDARAILRARQFSVPSLQIVDAYTIDCDLDAGQLEIVARMLANPVTTEFSLHALYPADFRYAIEVGYLPGVTDNLAATVQESIEDLLGNKLSGPVYSSQITFLKGESASVASRADSLANPLIQTVDVKTREEWLNQHGIYVPRVMLHGGAKADIVDIQNTTDQELLTIGKAGIANADGSRRGPLALDLSYMKAIQQYFLGKGRNPTDLELESIAQTWSEHCKHTIFADAIDEVAEGLFRTYIRGATSKVRSLKGLADFCVSVFTDNAGGIDYDDGHLVVFKIETHNAPSALDPFGGANTGLGGVIRDSVGFGMGAKPVINTYGFCFGLPSDSEQLYKDRGQKMLLPKRILDGVVAGVNNYGNCSGIPTSQGFAYFDANYKGKPLVFVGTVGLIPRLAAGGKSHEKAAQSGDYVVMVGGKVGKDGIHGATFSSEAIDAGSPATAVQIGDPITEKIFTDAIVREARDRGLYHSITDNGAGGLSCSVAEMAKESGGCLVELDKVPLKYPGLAPWEIWISESQERMTLAVPPEKWDAFHELMRRRGCESTVIGEFTDSGKCIVRHGGQQVMDIDMDFLHDGLPKRPLTTTFTRAVYEEPATPLAADLTDSMYSMLGRLNVASTKFISQQFDHEVQGGSVIKPLAGRGMVNGDATVTRPLLSSRKGVVLSQGINPSYSYIDTYNMAACAVDTAIRNAVAAGANPEQLALLDNFCWCSSNEPERLGQLKRAAAACYDYAVAFQAPFISGKDSMFNDFKGFDSAGNPVKISVPPTLLISAIGVIDDVLKSVSIDAKCSGDLVYVLGDTFDEMGASEYYAMHGAVGNNVPSVDAILNRNLYAGLYGAIQANLVTSAKSVGLGGLAVSLAKSALAGGLGMDVSLESPLRPDSMLYSESQGRIVVTVNPALKEQFEQEMAGNPVYHIGSVIDGRRFIIRVNSRTVIDADCGKMMESYKSAFEGY